MNAWKWMTVGAIFVSALASAGVEQDRNVQNALAFMSSWAKVPATELADRYLADEMIQHGAAMKDGKDAYRDFIAALAPRLNPQQPPTHRVVVAEKDLVVLLANQAVDMFRFDKHGKVIEKWGYSQQKGAAPGEPAGIAGHEERNRRNGKSFLEGLDKAADVGQYVKKYLALNFKRLDDKEGADLTTFAAVLADAVAHGARWHVKHSIAEKDIVVFIVANDQPAEPSPPPAKAPSQEPAPADREAQGSRGSPGCGEGAGYASPERGKPGRAAVIALRFHESGKITEYWQVEQPFNAYWACAGRWHANSLF